jgi:four helix bundle protein
MSEGKFRTFEDLEVWQEARKLRRTMYALAKRLPDHEKFNAAAQIRRAALSLTNNTAEGHGRFHYQENIQFLRQSRGSLEELLDDVTLCEDEQYAPQADLASLRDAIASVRRLQNAHIRYLKRQKESTRFVTREALAKYLVEDNEEEEEP